MKFIKNINVLNKSQKNIVCIKIEYHTIKKVRPL